MNRPLRRVAVGVLVLFAALMVNANYLQAYRADSLRNDPNNARVLIQQYQHERGSIIVGGDEVARSVATDDALKYLRRYPQDSLYAHVTGYYSVVSGATGIERAENDVLSGSSLQVVGSQLTRYLTGGSVVGASVLLTLDPAAQKAAQDGLAGMTGAVVAIEPATGRILAMASSPGFDPNRLATHDASQARAAYQELLADDGQPLLNRAIRQKYPPGSVFKLVTMAAALSSGDYELDTRVASPTELDLPLTSNTLKNFAGESCGDGQTTTLFDALRISCNTAFGQLGLDLGADALRAQADKFGLDADLTIPLDVSRSTFPADPDLPQTALSAIGQFDVALTPLQVAMIAAGIANNGVVMKPYLVQEVLSPDLTTLSQAEPTELSTAVSPEVAAKLKLAMVGVVESGTGTAARIPGISVAGKTGTAQHGAGQPPHAWFAGLAPAEDPRVAVAVIVEDGGSAGSEATGGRVAAPIAKAVMAAVLSGGTGG